MAVYAFNTLGLKNILVIDDVTTFGKGVADTFQAKFEELGGTVVDRVGARSGHHRLQRDHHRGQGQATPRRLLRRRRDLRWRPPPQADAPGRPRRSRSSAPDGIVNGNGDADGLADQHRRRGRRQQRIGTVAAIGDFPAKADFDPLREHFKADKEFKTPGAYSGPALRLRHVILKSLEETLKANAGRPGGHPRGRPRYASTRPRRSRPSSARRRSTRTATPTQPFISFYMVDLRRADGRRLGLQGAAELRRSASTREA